ncbi:MAG: 1-acyl-sn-glycerol-3-phosphate acyltransferase [Planctomycetota bacterium]
MFYRWTIFNTPLVTPCVRWLAVISLRLLGWRIKGRPPELDKFVVVAYPHTSNWDFPFTIALFFEFNLQIYWMGKSNLFVGPIGPLMRWLGGIPIKLDRPEGVVDQMTQAFISTKRLVVVISPESNRQRVKRWRTGFYHIALASKIPVVLDFPKKEAGYLGHLEPSGDLKADLKLIKAKYTGIRGLYPDQSELINP